MTYKILTRVGALSMAVAAVLFGVSARGAEDGVGIEFSHPDRIRYDNHSYIIDGKPLFIYSGSMHYFRVPKELWKDRLEKMKAAGFNTVETYLAWDVHEPEEPSGPEDFSKLRNMQDIGDFIQTAQDVGLYVSIRPGPYICAEWDRGGLPGWLLKDRPVRYTKPYLRTDDPTMLAWDKHWIEACAKVVKPHLVTNLPKGSYGVINWQLENEYDLNGTGLSPEVRANVLRALAHDAIDNGIDVPMFTCLTKDKAFREDPFLRSHVVDTTNSYPGFNMQGLIGGIEATAKYQPEKFRGISELQGGWFAQVGGKLSDQQGHNAAQINQLTLTAIEHGVTSMNYYMFYGGSNFGYGAAEGLIQSYDYNAPLREPGGIGDRYLAVEALAGMLKEHGEQLIHSEPVELKVENDQQGVSVALRRSADGSQFYFFRNSAQHEERKGRVEITPTDGKSGKITVGYELGDFGAKVLYLAPGVTDPGQGEWLPKGVPAPASVPASEIPAAVPVKITSIRADEPADNWVDVPEGKPLSAAGIYDQRFVTYRVKFELTADDLKKPLGLRMTGIGGGKGLVGKVNGVEVDSSGSGRGDVISLEKVAKAGENVAEILFENHGAGNFGPPIEMQQGITRVSLIPLDVVKQEGVTDWRMKMISGKLNDRPEVAVDFDDQEWKKVSVDGGPEIRGGRTEAVFRGTLNVTQEELASGSLPITFGSIDDEGTVYVNGEKVGESKDWATPFTVDVASKVHEGKNVVAVVVRNNDGGGGVYKGVVLDPAGKALTGLQVAPETEGMAGHWEKGDADIEVGTRFEIAKDVKNRKLLTWYNLAFHLPEPSQSVFVPWKLHLEADADAFVYLNGHNLGRYWAVGPQRDFWLPECWLNTGGTGIVVSLQALPTNGGDVKGVIKTVDVEPYGQYAERLDQSH